MSKTAALYARVSSDRQKEHHTIGSQVTALIQYADTHDYIVPSDWQFQDDGYSGATLIRPALEALRDVAAQGQIEAVLVHSPDRLSRKYAYQVLLAEELARAGVQLVFVNGPSGATPEDTLLLQFQGMIAEYERAQILERSRRGKRHRARQGAISVLGAAPYGYRYVKKTDTVAAAYDIVEPEAEVVRLIFDAYAREGLSINAIVARLIDRDTPTRSKTARWERSTVWGMLRNPAYHGRACFGKTETRPRQRVTRPVRQRGLCVTRNSANHERPRDEWIEIPVPALIDEATFHRAQERLEENKRYSPRRTIEPTLLQSMLVCARCGYALYRTSTKTSCRRLYYYRCLGADRYRHLRGAPCDMRPVRQDHLDAVVWREVLRLLDDPCLIQGEIDRRRDAAQRSDPAQRREETLRRDDTRLATSLDRLVAAYQEGLLTLEQLRDRVPAIRTRRQGILAELQALEAAATDGTRYLRLVESLTDFRARLRSHAETLDVKERQKILRLVVKEILVGPDTITIRHCIPVSPDTPDPSANPPPGPLQAGSGPGYLLRSGRHHPTLRCPAGGPRPPRPAASVRLLDGTAQPQPNQPQDGAVREAPLQLRHQAVVVDGVEVLAQVRVIHRLVARSHRGLHRVERLVRVPPRTESVRTTDEIRLEDRVDHQQHGGLRHAVPQRRDAERPPTAVGLRNVDAAHGLRMVAMLPQVLREGLQPAPLPTRLGIDGRPGDAIHTRPAFVRAHPLTGRRQDVGPQHVPEQVIESEPRFLLGLAAQFPAQQRDPYWQVRLRREAVGLPVRQRAAVAQSAPPSTTETCVKSGPFAPRALPRFVATMSRSDSRPKPSHGYGFPHAGVPPRGGTPRRVSQRPSHSVDARSSQSPRAARRVRMLVASSSVAGFSISGRLAAATVVSRGRIGFACARARVFAVGRGPSPWPVDAPAAPTNRSASHVWLPSRAGPPLHAERAIHMADSFQSARVRRTHWRTRGHKEHRDRSVTRGAGLGLRPRPGRRPCVAG